MLPDSEAAAIGQEPVRSARQVTSSIAEATAPLLPAGDEAKAQVAALLKTGKTGIPNDLLIDHVYRLHGAAGFVILRAAAEATHRRMQIAATEKLRVRERPAGGVFGDYRTAKPRQQLRPYTTRLYQLDPLEASCDCPDFRGNSLGL